MSASTEDGAAGENLETQGRRLFVSLKRRINSALKFPSPEMHPHHAFLNPLIHMKAGYAPVSTKDQMRCWGFSSSPARANA
jgi:hypothetical protein